MGRIAGVNGVGDRLANGGRAIPHRLASCVAQPGIAAKEVVAAADSMLYAAMVAIRMGSDHLVQSTPL